MRNGEDRVCIALRAGLQQFQQKVRSGFASGIATNKDIDHLRNSQKSGNDPDEAAIDAKGSDRMSIQDVVNTIKGRVESSGFDRSVKFDTGGDGVIVIDGASISTADGPADCTIKLSLDDLEALVAGDLNPTMAFMTGKIKIEGDMSVAMALSQLIG